MRRPMVKRPTATDGRSAPKCQRKLPDQPPRPPSGLPEVTVAVRIALLPGRKAGKTREFTPVRGGIWRIPVEAMFQAPARPAPAWGDMVRRASPHSGPWPRVSICHGDADSTVVPANANEIVKQWRDFHGLPEAPTLTEDVNGHARDVWRDATGADVIL